MQWIPFWRFSWLSWVKCCQQRVQTVVYAWFLPPATVCGSKEIQKKKRRTIKECPRGGPFCSGCFCSYWLFVHYNTLHCPDYCPSSTEVLASCAHNLRVAMMNALSQPSKQVWFLSCSGLVLQWSWCTFRPCFHSTGFTVLAREHAQQK